MRNPRPEQFPSSPKWSKSTRLFVATWVMLFFVALLWIFSSLVISIVSAAVLALIIRPIVDWIDNKLVRLPRIVTTIVVYGVLLGSFLAIPLSATPNIIRQVTALINNFPNLVNRVVENTVAFLSEPIVLFGGRYIIPTNQISVDQYQQLAGDVVSIVGTSAATLSGFASDLATLTVGFVSRLVFVLFLAFWLTHDGHRATNALIHAAPPEYHEDIHYIIERIGLIWGAFLRGQLILMVVMGCTTFVIASALGLPNPVALAVVAGVAEVIPYAGPIIASVPAMLIAYFQADVSWLGMLLTPFWFTVIVGGFYWLQQQLENYLLLPRIIGHQLNLHPAIVFVAAIAGYQIAGVLGILLASPTVATVRLFLSFINGKLFDRPVHFQGDPIVAEDSAEVPVDPLLESVATNTEITLEDASEWTKTTPLPKQNPSSSGQPATTANLPTTSS